MEPAEPFTATARSRDGIVEAMELKPEHAAMLPFLLSVQFHPERLVQKHARYRAIFETVCGSVCKTYKTMKGKILIVDDEADLRAMLKAIPGRSDYTVTRSRGRGGACTNVFPQDAPDVVLLDLNLKLPDANGLDLLPQIKKTWPETEVIVLTGEATFEAAVQATKRGAYPFHQQADSTRRLCQVTIDRAIENRQQKEESNSLRRASPP